MAKDLPYFKFGVSEYINGDITLEDFYTQGVFINICAFYWFKSGKVTLTELKRRLSKATPKAFQTLCDSDLIKVEHDSVSISFLDEQLKEREHHAARNSENGKLGGRGHKKESETKATPLIPESETKAKKSNIEEKREEEKRREKKENADAPFDGELLLKWNEWEQHRKEKRQTLTPTARKKQIKFLGGRPPNEAIGILNYSLENGYTGLFSPTKNNANRNGTKTDIRRADATIESGTDFGNL